MLFIVVVVYQCTIINVRVSLGKLSSFYNKVYAVLECLKNNCYSGNLSNYYLNLAWIVQVCPFSEVGDIL